MQEWMRQAIFYHIYPLGMLGCEPYHQNHVVHRLPQLQKIIPHLQRLHVNAVYLGPIFQSESHGYDTIDYYQIDERLGDHQDMKELVEAFHQANIKVIVDAVFHHVGRSFWAFQDVLKHREKSAYVQWFSHIDFTKDNVYHDGFCYDTWKGAAPLVKLNLAHVDVQKHLLGSVQMWMDEYHIDGLRLDAAECMIYPFFEQLHFHVKQQNPNFYLMGEVVFGDYSQWIYPYRLDAVTNYELYHALHHCHNSHNYYELQHTLERQFGKEGLYQNLCLYHFVDNHDVHRIASLLKQKEKLYHIYTLLFTLPGTPSIYYGSEWGIKGRKQRYSDAKLRPMLDPSKKRTNKIMKHMMLLTKLRSEREELQDGTLTCLYTSEEQFVYCRSKINKTYIFLNQSQHEVKLKIVLPEGSYHDILQNKTYLHIKDKDIYLDPYGIKILLESEGGI